MSARAWGYVVVGVVLFALLGTAYLFVVQNSLRATQLSLDLGFAAWQLAEPVPIVALVGLAFGAGFALAALIFGVRGVRTSRRLRKLEQEVALGVGVSGGWRSESRSPSAGDSQSSRAAASGRC